MPKVTTTLFGDIALLPFQFKQPMRQTLKWVTDLFEAQSSKEQADQCRETPRESFNVTIKENHLTKQRGFNTEYGAIGLKWGLPLFQEAQYVGNVTAGNTTLACVTEDYDFRPSSLALLLSGRGPDSFQVLEINTVGDGVLNLSNVTIAVKNAYLMPVRVGRVDNTINRRANGMDVLTELTFESDEAYALTPDAPEQYLGDDVYWSPPILDGDMTYAVSRRVDVVDYEIGPVTTRTPWAHARVGRPYNVVCTTPAEVMAFKLWLYRRIGKYRRYWEPSFEQDFRFLGSGTINSTLLIGREGMTDWTPQRVNIAVELDDGTWLPRVVSSYANLTPTTAQINLAVSLGGINASRIRRISYMGLKRLDTDMVELSWIGNGVMKSTVGTIEVEP